MEIVCNMLATKHLPNDYWVEVVSTAIYIMNRFPIKSVNKMIPQEAWTCMKHSASDLKVFGCVAYADVLDELRKKFDKKEIYMYICWTF